MFMCLFLASTQRERKISPKFFWPKFFHGRPRGMSVPKCLFFQDLEGLTEVFGRMSTGISGQKLPLWAEFSFLTPRACEKCSRGFRSGFFKVFTKVFWEALAHVVAQSFAMLEKPPAATDTSHEQTDGGTTALHWCTLSVKVWVIVLYRGPRPHDKLEFEIFHRHVCDVPNKLKNLLMPLILTSNSLMGSFGKGSLQKIFRKFLRNFRKLSAEFPRPFLAQ